LTIVDAPARARIQPEHIHRSALLSSVPGIIHGVTRRVAGAGMLDGNVGCSPPRDRNDAWAMRERWMEAAGLDAEQLVVGSQVHGSAVAIVSSHAQRARASSIGPFDGLATDQSGVVLFTLHADCMPIMAVDPVQRAVATVHAGWRGTVSDIAGETVRAMSDAFASDPANLLVFLGPAIGACCYEVGDDVRGAWAEQSGGEELQPFGSKWTFDLDRANRVLLTRAGVPAAQIESSGICTRCSAEEWFSHRGQGPATGRYGAFIAIQPN
jgi:YfiH family protein